LVAGIPCRALLSLLVRLTTFPLLTLPWRASVPVRVIVPERVQFVRWLRTRQRGLEFLKLINTSLS